ncbi:MAG: hypothetical protein ACRYFW_11035 [Janthinobacterium lividum]
MSMSGVIRDAWRDTDQQDRACEALEITPDKPQTWAAHACFKMPPDAALKVGDRVTIPVHGADGHVVCDDGLPLRMLGGVYDRDAPLR